MKCSEESEMCLPDELLELIKSRRSIRKFTSQSVPDHVLQTALEAAVWAPSACNQQPLRFVVVKSQPDLRVLNACKMHIRNPQAAILFVLDIGSDYYQKWYADPHTQQNPILDVGAAVQNMTLVFHAYGLASCWVSFSPHLNYQGYEAFFRRFRLPETCRVSSGLFVGYPAQTIDIDRHTHHGRPIRRKPAAEYVLELPPRVLLLGAHPFDFDNLGSQAMTDGMKRLIQNEFGDSEHALLEYPWDLPWYGFPTYQFLDGQADVQREESFSRAVDSMVLLGRMLRDEREQLDHRSLFTQAKQVVAAGIGAFRGRPISPNILRYNPRLNDPLLVGRCPVLPELPEGTARGADGWLVAAPADFHRFLTRQLGPIAVRVLPKLSMHLLRHQFKGVSPSHLARYSLFSWSDIVFCDGDGAFADDWPWSRDLVIRMLAEWLAAKRLGAKVFAVNQTVSIQTPWLRRLVASVCNQLDGIAVREPVTKSELVSMGVRSGTVFLAADAATWADFSGSARFEQNIPPSDLLRLQDGIALFVRGDMYEDVKMWSDLVVEIQRSCNRPVVYIPSCREDDLPFAHAVAESSPLIVLDKVKYYQEAFSLLEHMSLVVSSRYHPVYFSILAGIPFVAIRGNTFKNRGLLQLIEYPLPLIEEGDVKEQVIQQIQTILGSYSALRETVLAIKERLHGMAMLNVKVAENASTYSLWIEQLKADKKHSDQETETE